MSEERSDAQRRIDAARYKSHETRRERTRLAVVAALHENLDMDDPLRVLDVQGIAKDAGVGKSTLEYHFPAKEDLIADTARFEVGETLQTIFTDTEVPELRRRLTATKYLVDYSFDKPHIAKHLATVISDYPNRDFISPLFDRSLEASGVIDPNIRRLQSRILTMTILQAGVEQPRQGDVTEYRNVVRHRINQMVIHGFSAAPQA